MWQDDSFTPVPQGWQFLYLLSDPVLLLLVFLEQDRAEYAVVRIGPHD